MRTPVITRQSPWCTGRFRSVGAPFRGLPRVAAPAVVALLLAGHGATQTGRESPARPGASAPESKQQPYVVGVVGASVSAGFCMPIRKGAFGEKDSTKRIGEVLERTYPKAGNHQPIRWVDAAYHLTFQAPYKHLGKQVDVVTEQPVDCIIALDFPFWLGYGPRFMTEEQRRRREEGEITLHELRLEMGVEALKMIDRMREGCSGPILIGDYPDMSDTRTRLLFRGVIPPAETRRVLNQRLREFAKARPDVVVLSLEGLLDRVQREGYTIVAEGQRYRAQYRHLMQWDRLHLNQVGIAVMVDEILKQLAPKLPNDSPLLRGRPDLEAMLEFTGGIDYLEDLENLGPVPTGKDVAGTLKEGAAAGGR